MKTLMDTGETTRNSPNVLCLSSVLQWGHTVIWRQNLLYQSKCNFAQSCRKQLYGGTTDVAEQLVLEDLPSKNVIISRKKLLAKLYKKHTMQEKKLADALNYTSARISKSFKINYRLD